MEEDVCPICRDKPKDIFITSCNHAFCGPCICNYLFRAVTGTHGAVRAVCPSCRQPVRSCSTTTHTSSNISFKLGGVLLEVDVPQAAPTARLAKLLKAPTSSIKLLHKGRKLHGDKELLEAAALKGHITLLPAMLPPVRPPQKLAQSANRLLLCLWYLLLRFVLQPVWRWCKPGLLRVYAAVQPALRVAAACLHSVNPQFSTPPVMQGDAGGGDQQLAHAAASQAASRWPDTPKHA